MGKITCLLFLVVAFCCFQPPHLSAQVSKTDSLRKLLAKVEGNGDTTEVLLLLQIAIIHELSNADSVARYSKRALWLSEKLKYPRGIANATEMTGGVYSMLGKYDSAVLYFNTALDLAKKHSLDDVIASKYNHIANIHLFKAQYADALVYYDSAINAAQAVGNIIFEGEAYGNKANVYYKVGNYTRALQYYLKSQELLDQVGNPGKVTINYSNIANVYYRLRQYDKAIQWLNKGYELNLKKASRQHLIGNLTTYALIYNDRKMNDSSLHYLNEALGLAKLLKDPYTENILQGNIAECYLKMGDYDRSLHLYEQSHKISAELDDAEGLALAKAGMGDILIVKGNHAKGRGYLLQALEMLQNLGIMEQARDVAGKLAASFEKTGDYKQALHYYQVQTGLADSLAKVKSRQEIEQLMFDYEIGKKEAQIKLLEKDKAIIDHRRKTQQVFLWAVSVGFLLALISAFLFYLHVHSERKNRSLIQKQNKELEEQAKKLEELNLFKDNTFSVLAHDLRSPVNALTSTMMLLDEKVITPEEFIEYKHELNSKLQAVSLLLDNILYWAKSQMKGENSLDIQKIDVRAKVARVIAVLDDAARQKHIFLRNKVADNTIAYADKDQLDIVLRNIIANAIKFTHHSGEVSITSFRDNGNIHISIADNGVGMTPGQISSLFDPDKFESTKSTVGERGTGLGLQLCFDIVKRHGGELKVNSNPGLGSVFTIILPAQA